MTNPGDVGERCDRCGSAGYDRRTLSMACFYDMNELGIPFRDRVTFLADPADLTPAELPFVLPGEGGRRPITLSSGTVKCSGELRPYHLFQIRVCKRCRGEWLASIKGWFGAAPGGEDYDADGTDAAKGGSAGDNPGSGIFVRENGALREITRGEWDAKYPGREPVSVRRGTEGDPP